MDYRAETELGSLCRELLDDLERVRPGLPAEAAQAEVLTAAARRVDVRLQEIYRERYDLGEEINDSAQGQESQLSLYRREVDQILLPRWAALAHQRNAAERAGSRGGAPLRGADAFNRGAWALLFLLLGAFVVWAPFIPIWEKWIPFAASVIAAIFAPVLPDLHGALGRRRYKLQLLTLLIDLDHAGRALPLSPAAPALPASPPAQAGPHPPDETEKGSP